jgi:hypothetical protein
MPGVKGAEGHGSPFWGGKGGYITHVIFLTSLHSPPSCWQDMDVPPIYELVAVSIHVGSTAKKGHYVARCKHGASGMWYTYNDTRISVASEECMSDSWFDFSIPNKDVGEPMKKKTKKKKEKKKDVGLILKGAYVLFYVLKADTEGAVSTGEEKDGKDDGNGAGQTST